MKKVHREYHRSSSFKMAILFTVLLGLSAIMLTWTLHDLSEETYIRETEAVITSEMSHLLERIQQLTFNQKIEFLQARVNKHVDTALFFYDSDEKILVGTHKSLPANVNPIAEGVVGFRLPVGQHQHRFAAKVHTFPSGNRLLIARDIQNISESYSRLNFLSLLILVFMLIVVLVSFFISTFVVSRINRIANTAQSIIETGDLSHRISIESRWDDLSNLAFILNSLLERMELLMQGVRNAGHNIAHDLRTPLTRLRAHLEQVKQQAAQQRIEPEVMDTLIGEADHILVIFNALLRIASLESGKRMQVFSPVDVAEVVADVLELYEPVAEEKLINVSFAGAEQKGYSEVMGDRDLLFQVFANLIDNAIKYTPVQGNVWIAIERFEKRVKVTITDSGEGVPAADLDRLCERFFRSDKSRTTQGSGLGLSLVKAAVDLHGGELSFTLNSAHQTVPNEESIEKQKVRFSVTVEL